MKTARPRPVRAAPVIVAFGDSLTSGPGFDAGRRPTLPCFNSGSPARAATTASSTPASLETRPAEALRRFDAALVPGTKIVILAIGANDGLRGVPVATVERNISTMIERAQARGIDVLLCQMEAPPVGGLSYTIEFHRVFTRLAERYKVPLVPFFLIGIVGNDELEPQRHPSPERRRAPGDRRRHLAPLAPDALAALLSSPTGGDL